MTDRQIIKMEMIRQIAEAVATASTCLKKKVGAVIFTEDFHIKGVGYNGTPSGVCHCSTLDNHHEFAEKYEVHAEVNACASSDSNLKGCYCYCTYEPCNNCLKVLAAHGIHKVFFTESKDCNAQIASELGIELKMWKAFIYKRCF